MKILVVEANNADREALAVALRGTRHALELLSQPDAAIRRGAELDADVLVLGAQTLAATVDVVRRLKAMPRRPYLLLVAPAWAQDDLDAAFAAGIDDFIRKPFARDELRVRVEAPLRMGNAPARAEPRPLVILDGTGGAASVSALSAWSALPDSIVAEVAGVLGAAVTMSASTSSMSSSAIIARLSCTLPSERAVVDLTIGVDREALKRISAAVFEGDVTDEMGADVLCELANSAGGAFKRTALAEGVSFTIGLPNVLPKVPTASAEAALTRGWQVECRSLRAEIFFTAAIRTIEPTFVPAAELREGMVLATDLKSAAGALIATAGTRITASNAERVARFLGAYQRIEIAAAN